MAVIRSPRLGGVLGRFVLAGHGLDVDDAGPRLHPPGQQREVLAQRVALELAGQVEVGQVGVALEDDAEHLPRLALVPVGAGVDGHPGGGRQRRGVVAQVGLEHQADALHRVVEPGQELEAGVATGVAGELFVGRLLGGAVDLQVLLAVHVPPERRGHPVDGGQEVEEAEAEAVPGVGPGRHPGGEADPGPDLATGIDVGGEQGVAQALGQYRRPGPRAARRPRPRPPARGWRRRWSLRRPPNRRQLTTSGSPFQRSAGSSSRICSCSRTIASSRASGRGGQPGTYTSTGMIWSTPLVTEYESQ